MTPKEDRLKTKRVIAIQCWKCGYWNVPKINKSNKIVYSNACKNNKCRTTSYMKTKSQVMLEKKERGKNLSYFSLPRKHKITMSQVYNMQT